MGSHLSHEDIDELDQIFSTIKNEDDYLNVNSVGVVFNNVYVSTKISLFNYLGI